jgi:hypothetical protein
MAANGLLISWADAFAKRITERSTSARRATSSTRARDCRSWGALGGKSRCLRDAQVRGVMFDGRYEPVINPNRTMPVGPRGLAGNGIALRTPAEGATSFRSSAPITPPTSMSSRHGTGRDAHAGRTSGVGRPSRALSIAMR